ncbi:unnamed protein product [Brassica napus]|uniref:(rape) hypothetical protein n=1 Tax=Brassica napus TaxID=3708 RepID=A0A816P2H7_BRANA|nr:unnamed protein product [Brassica napus]
MLLMNLPVTKRMKRPKSYPAADAESSKMNKLMIKAVEVEKDIIVQIQIYNMRKTLTGKIDNMYID